MFSVIVARLYIRARFFLAEHRPCNKLPYADNSFGTLRKEKATPYAGHCAVACIGSSVYRKPNAIAGTSKTKAVVLGLLLSTSITKAVVLGLMFSTSTNIRFRFASLLGFLFLSIPKF